MATRFVLWIALVVFLSGFGTVGADTTAVSPQRLIQDPKTKMVFYIESDRRHIAAITPEGKLLWCREVFSRGTWQIDRIKLENAGITVEGGSGHALVLLNSETGGIDVKEAL